METAATLLLYRVTLDPQPDYKESKAGDQINEAESIEYGPVAYAYTPEELSHG